MLIYTTFIQSRRRPPQTPRPGASRGWKGPIW